MKLEVARINNTMEREIKVHCMEIEKKALIEWESSAIKRRKQFQVDLSIDVGSGSFPEEETELMQFSKEEQEWEVVHDKDWEEMTRKIERDRAEMEPKRVKPKSLRVKSVPLAVFEAKAVRKSRGAASGQGGNGETAGSRSTSATSPYSLAQEPPSIPSVFVILGDDLELSDDSD